MHSVENRFVIGPSNTLSEGMYVCTLHPGNFTGCGNEGVKNGPIKIAETRPLSSVTFCTRQAVLLTSQRRSGRMCGKRIKSDASRGNVSVGKTQSYIMVSSQIRTNTVLN